MKESKCRDCGHGEDEHPEYKGDTGCVKMMDFVFEGDIETAICECKKFNPKKSSKPSKGRIKK